MAAFTIKHEHAQNETTVRAVLKHLLVQLKHDYQISSTWDGHVIHFHRSGASGTLNMHPHCVEVQIKLSLMLGMFEKKIRASIADYCAEHLP